MQDNELRDNKLETTDKIPQAEESTQNTKKDVASEKPESKKPSVPYKPQKPVREARPPKPPKTSEQLAWEKARHDDFIKNMWLPVLKPVVVLFSVCLIASLLLGLTNSITLPVITENIRLESENARKSLLSSADDFTAVEIPEKAENVTAIWQANNGVGYVIEAFANGYGGKVPAIVALDANGTIIGVQFLQNSETVGLGSKVREPSFANQFSGLANKELTLADIDGITSATISSGAAVNAVNNAISAYNLISGGADIVNMNEEEVRAYLLPGEELSIIESPANDLTPLAWKSTSGNYILYGTAASNNPNAQKPVTAAVAVNSDGVILNLWLDTSGEGESYGAQLVYNSAFMNSFIGLSMPVVVDAVAGVTNSSNTVMQAVNNALAKLAALKETS
jgi:electron transport complex protein RnfG